MVDRNKTKAELIGEVTKLRKQLSELQEQKTIKLPVEKDSGGGKTWTHQLIDTAVETMTMLDHEGRILVMNKAAAQSLGGKPQDFIGKTVWDLFPPQIARERMAPAWEILSSGKGSVVEFPLDIHDKEYWFHASNQPVKDESGSTYAVATVSIDITALKQAEKLLRESLQEKELLIRELYHRTKNNMQVIIALLTLQAGFTEDKQVQAVFQETKNRIQSMALVHEKLYKSQNLSTINLDEYISELVQLLISSYQVSTSQVQLVFEMEQISTLIDIVVPCGLILNELISNALQHAFPENHQGEIRIVLHRPAPGEIILEVKDNGQGVAEDLNLRNFTTFGLQAVTMMVEHQLQGKVQFKQDQGVSCLMRFRDDIYQKRV